MGVRGGRALFFNFEPFSKQSLLFTALVFTDLQKWALENIVGRGENAGNQHFHPYSHNVFFPNSDRDSPFSNTYIVVCKSFQFSHGQNFVVR